MFSLFWIFAGFVVGLLISSVFTPPIRNIPQLPTPKDKSSIHTDTGCVTFHTTEVPCVKNTTSLNFIASQHK